MQPLLQWKSNKYYIFWVSVCRLGYPTCNAYAACCHLWPVRLCSIFPHYLIYGTVLKNVIIYKMCVSIFSTILPEIFLILRRNERDEIKNVHCSSCRVPVIFVKFSWNLNFLHRFSKILKHKISWKTVQWEPRRSTRRDKLTDRHKWRSHSRLSQFCERSPHTGWSSGGDGIDQMYLTDSKYEQCVYSCSQKTSMEEMSRSDCAETVSAVGIEGRIPSRQYCFG